MGYRHEGFVLAAWMIASGAAAPVLGGGGDCTPGSAGQPVDLDLASFFNADVIVNDSGGGLDPSQSPIDLGTGATNNFAFPTQTVADALNPGSPDGLPDDAFFPAGSFHPDVQLGYSNADDGDNARRSADSTDTFTVPVAPAPYSEMHVFATTGNGSSDITVTLAYDDLSSDVFMVNVPDWFDDPTQSFDTYQLIGDLDRINPGAPPGTPFDYADSDDPAVFGFGFSADPAKALTGVTVERTDATGVLNVFGITGLCAAEGAPVVEIPTLDVAGLALLAILMAAAGALLLYRRQIV